MVNRINNRTDDNKKYYMKIKEEKSKYKQRIINQIIWTIPIIIKNIIDKKLQNYVF